MGEYLEYASGCSHARDSYQAGTEAAQQAMKYIEKYQPTLVVVFASVQHEFDRALAGVRNIVGSVVPTVGCSTAGEYCGKLLSGTVTVTILASPHMEVKVGVGRNVSSDYTAALHEVIAMAGAGEFFNTFGNKFPAEDNIDHTSKPFALLFMPGPLKNRAFNGKELVDIIRRRTMNSLPLLGACAGDDCRWTGTYQFFQGEVYEDCVVMVFVKTRLRFGIATVYNYIPMKPKIIVTKCRETEILELNGIPAADFFADVLGVEFADLMVSPTTYLYNNPFGIKDISGFYHILPGTSITPDHGIKCLHPIEEGTVVRVLEPSSEELLNSADGFLRKAILRGKITKPLAGMIFSSVHRVNSLRELIPLALQKLQKSLKKSIKLSGFCSYGEVGLTDEGINSYFNMTLSGIIFGDELNEAAQVATKNVELCVELKEAAKINKELYKELSMVHQLTNLLNSSLKLRSVVSKAVNMVAQMMKADGCIMFLYDQDNDTIRDISHFGISEIPKELDLKSTLPYMALKEERNLLLKNTDDIKGANLSLSSLVNAQSATISPVLVKKQKVGVIAVYSKEPNFYSHKDLEFLETLVNQIGIAVVNADLYERTELLACTDGLTGLYDHNYFLKAFDRLLSRAEEKSHPLSMIMVDLDDFKYFNDKYGHTVGDLILKTVAQILRDNVRSEDIIARYGGDEFAVILVNAGETKATRISERISINIANEPFSDPESRNVFYITASVGIATYPIDAASCKELIDTADKAMYQMKRSTKSKTQSYLAEFEELETQLTASEKALLDTIKLLIQVLDSRDRYTWEHCRQVSRYAVGIAERLGLGKEAISKLKLAGYLHDMGKIHVSPEVLNKRGWLSDGEMETVKLHPVVGANLLSPIKGFADIKDIIYHHHEWFDGTGYPEGLKGEQIPIGARILAIADGFDAMTSNRPYRKAQTFEWALTDLKKQSGSQYDPQCVEAFIKFLLDEGNRIKKRQIST